MKKSVKKSTPKLSDVATSDVQKAASTKKSTKKTVRKTAKKSATRAKRADLSLNAEDRSEKTDNSSESEPVSEKKAILKKVVKKATVKKATTKKSVRKTSKKTIKKTKVNEKADLSDNGKSLKNDDKSESNDLAALETVFSQLECSGRERERRERRELEKKHFVPSPIEREYSGELPFWEPGWLLVRGARQNNLKSIDVPFPLSAFTVVSGVSGSGKSSLVEDVVYRTLARVLNRSQVPCGACDDVLGVERINKVVQVDQAPIGQTPTSNAATYVGVFDLIRQLYAQLPEAKLRGYSPRRFSFNVPGGRCEKCEGAGQLKVEMHFLADVWIVCDACGGKRYDAETLQVKFRGKSIADALDMTCGDALKLFERVPSIARILRTLCDVGLDYLTLGQSAPTLSGGEAQRVKLAAELSRVDSGRTLYLLDEPTTGLHFEDIRKLLDVLHRLVDLGNTVVVVEHNLDVVKNADWIVDIGPEAGLEGGRLVFAGVPERLAEYSARWKASPELQKTSLRSYTGEALIPEFLNGTFEERPVLDVRAYLESQKPIAIEESEELAEEIGSEPTPTPWETDGRRWHCELRTSRGGAPCRWDGRILSAVVDRIEESSFFAETNWNNRTIVEICAEKKSLGWFFHAITGEEWLLKLKFRTAKNTFNKEILVRKLNLRPLNEVDEIPLYGTQPRVKLETVGPWQEIELKVYSYAEIERPEFWEFVDFAIERFGELTDRAKENAVDLTPWKTQARDWHLSPGACYGGSEKPRWPFEILEKTFEIVESIPSDSTPVWTNKIVVPFYRRGAKRPWCQVYTKNCDSVCVQVNVPKGFAPLGRVAGIGFAPEVDVSNVEYDSVDLRFRTQNDFMPEKLREFLLEAFEKIRADDEN